MLQEASGHYFPSTPHRVINPTGKASKNSRISLPLFLHPRPDVILSDKYTAESYLRERLIELGVLYWIYFYACMNILIYKCINAWMHKCMNA